MAGTSSTNGSSKSEDILLTSAQTRLGRRSRVLSFALSRLLTCKSMRTRSRYDPLLTTYLEASSERAERDALDHLSAKHLRPLIGKLLKRRFSGPVFTAVESEGEQASDDLCQEALLTIVRHLQQLKRGSAGDLHDLNAYASQVTRNLFSDYLRRKRPARWSLEGKVRYVSKLLGTTELWDRDGHSVIGRSEDRRLGRSANHRKLQMLINSPCRAARAFADGDVSSVPLAELLTRLLNWLDGFASLDQVVQALVQILGLVDPPQVSQTSKEGVAVLDLLDTSPSADVLLEMREMLRALWAEVLLLPPRQKMAVLLNLRDDKGRGVIALLPIAGIATVAEIASALEMSEQDLHAVWQALPIDDREIAERLGLSAPDVANLRAVGRARLKRRIAKSEHNLSGDQ